MHCESDTYDVDDIISDIEELEEIGDYLKDFED